MGWGGAGGVGVLRFRFEFLLGLLSGSHGRVWRGGFRSSGV